MNNGILTFEEWKVLNSDYDGDELNEKLLISKRKYTERYPEIKNSTNAPKRSLILKIVNDYGTIPMNDLISIVGDKSWLLKNKHLFIIRKTPDGTFLKLSKQGSRILHKVHLK